MCSSDLMIRRPPRSTRETTLFPYRRSSDLDRYGALVSEAARRALPISFLATGQQIPDDLEPATQERLVQLVFASPALAVRTAGAGA